MLRSWIKRLFSYRMSRRHLVENQTSSSRERGSKPVRTATPSRVTIVPMIRVSVISPIIGRENRTRFIIFKLAPKATPAPTRTSDAPTVVLFSNIPLISILNHLTSYNSSNSNRHKRQVLNRECVER